MKFILTLIFSLIIISNSFSQMEDTVMNHFDIKNYNILKSRNEDSYFLSDSTKVSFIESNSSYQMKVTNHHSDFSKYYLYFKSTLTLKSYVEEFKRMYIGVRKEYDSTGKLIEVEDYDAPFTFGLFDLQRKLIDNYKIDIMDFKQKIGVSRSQSFSPTYDVAYYLTDNSRGKLRILRFDGLNGNLIFDVVKEDYEK